MKDRTSRIHVLIPAAGRGARFGSSDNKVFADLCGLPVIARTARSFGLFADSLTIIGREAELEKLRSAVELTIDPRMQINFIVGGESRQDSVANGIRSLTRESDDSVVLVHDGARPLISSDVIARCIASATDFGSGIAALPVHDTLKLADSDGRVLRTQDRTDIWAMQTPQAFRLGILRRAVAASEADGYVGTDEASIVERLGDVEVRLSLGSKENIKITTPEDLEFAARWLESQPLPDVRVGTGYDIHRLVEGRELWLGGVKIEAEYGLLGHSDADVLLHALCDSLLGAAGMPDIGNLYPNTDPRYAGAPSVTFLTDVRDRLCTEGWTIQNVDMTLIAERPKIARYVPAMKATIAQVLEIEESRIGIKATTQEGIGSLGAGEGIACHAVASIMRRGVR